MQDGLVARASKRLFRLLGNGALQPGEKCTVEPSLHLLSATCHVVHVKVGSENPRVRKRWKCKALWKESPPTSTSCTQTTLPIYQHIQCSSDGILTESQQHLNKSWKSALRIGYFASRLAPKQRGFAGVIDWHDGLETAGAVVCWCRIWAETAWAVGKAIESVQTYSAERERVGLVMWLERRRKQHLMMMRASSHQRYGNPAAGVP